MPTNGDFDGFFSSINNVPIFTYGMITITALVLSYMTFMDEGIKTDEEAIEALGQPITNSLGSIPPSITDTSTTIASNMDTNFTPKTDTPLETNILNPSTETPLGIETPFNTESTISIGQSSLQEPSSQEPSLQEPSLQESYEEGSYGGQPYESENQDRFSSERYSTGGKTRQTKSNKGKKKTTRKNRIL